MNHHSIEDKINRSSLGAPRAVIARSKVSRSTAAQIVARSQSATITSKSPKKL